jgi:hypothetical protein
MNLKFKQPDFDPPILGQEKSPKEKFKAFFTPQVNAALIAFVSTALITSLVWALNTLPQIKATPALRQQIVNLNQQILTNGLEINKLTIEATQRETRHGAEINKLTTENKSLEDRMAIYSAIPAQVPALMSNVFFLISTQPTNQQQLLNIAASIQALTNSLAEVSLRPEFQLSVNDTLITTNTDINLKASRILRIEVQNTSPLVADQLTLQLCAPSLLLDPTNFIAPEWHSNTLKSTMTFVGYPPIEGRCWSWHADSILPLHHIYYVASVEIATNYAHPVLPLFLDIYSSRSKARTLILTLHFL